MRVRIKCPAESCRHSFETPVDEQTRKIHCPLCGQLIPWNHDAISPTNLKVCPVCACEEMFVRKDFPQRLGLAMVIVVGLASCWLFARGQLLWSLGVLVGLVLVDLAIFRFVPKITSCYRCRTEFLDAPHDPEHVGFDLATSEKYR